jgi:hypothetical protein
MDTTCKALVDDLAKLMEQHINAFDARGESNWGVFRQGGLAQKGAKRATLQPQALPPCSIAPSRPLLLSPSLPPGLANAAWALGRLRYAGPSRELPALIASAARTKLPEFCAQNIANTL